jgi:hypothetical protein
LQLRGCVSLAQNKPNGNPAADVGGFAPGGALLPYELLAFVLARTPWHRARD